MQSCTAAGTAPKPTIHLHAVSLLPYSPNSQPTMYATTWPRVMKTTVVVTSRPRCAAGASSAMYSGTTKLAPPTAAPTMERPATMLATVVLPAWSRAPVMKSISATRMTRFRPSESARSEANGETRRANSEVHEVMMDLSSEVSALPESEVPIDTRVAEMTPVSSVVVGQRLSDGAPSTKHQATRRRALTAKQEAAYSGGAGEKPYEEAWGGFVGLLLEGCGLVVVGVAISVGVVPSVGVGDKGFCAVHVVGAACMLEHKC